MPWSCECGSERGMMGCSNPNCTVREVDPKYAFGSIQIKPSEFKPKEENVIAVHRIEGNFIVFTNKAIYKGDDNGAFEKVESNYGDWENIKGEK